MYPVEMNAAATMAKRAARSSSSSSNRPSWVDLPPELTANIFQRLTVKDIFQSAKVCTTWRSVSRDPSIWRFVDLGSMRIYEDTPKDCDKICREVVNRSQGQLISIRLGFFATDDLLFYIAQRAKRLRHLRIWSHHLSDEAFSKAVIEFPLLEELEVEYSGISKKSIEAAGNSCPFLKSFSFNKEGVYQRGPSDEEALAVAENMHDLKHLALVGNDLTDEGVEAILDGCPHLEFLDLDNCNHVSLEGDLGKRCSQQIKDLTHCFNPFADYDLTHCFSPFADYDLTHCFSPFADYYLTHCFNPFADNEDYLYDHYRHCIETDELVNAANNENYDGFEV